jgi:uncharacterized membrane protein (UPF0127 family)
VSTTPVSAGTGDHPTITTPDRLRGLPAQRHGEVWIAEADSRRARRRGLARLDELPGDWGLLIPRCRSVHTFGMRFPLDLIFLGAGDELVRVDRELGPRRLATCLAARSVLEVRGGSADRFLRALGCDAS